MKRSRKYNLNVNLSEKDKEILVFILRGLRRQKTTERDHADALIREANRLEKEKAKRNKKKPVDILYPMDIPDDDKRATAVSALHKSLDLANQCEVLSWMIDSIEENLLIPDVNPTEESIGKAVLALANQNNKVFDAAARKS